MQSRELVYAFEDRESGRYVETNGWLTFGSDASGSISSTAISHHMYQPSACWILAKFPLTYELAQSNPFSAWCYELNQLPYEKGKWVTAYQYYY